MRKLLLAFGVVVGIALVCQPALADPGISVTIDVVDKITGGSDLSAEYKVKIESITTADEEANLTIRPATSGELSSGEQPADISWFDWTYKEFDLPGGAVQEYPLQVTLPAGVPMGNYRFVAEGKAIDPTMSWMPAESSDGEEVIVTTEETIPEFTTIAIPVAALLGLVFLFKRMRRG